MEIYGIYSYIGIYGHDYHELKAKTIGMFAHKNTLVSASSWFDGKLVSSLQIIWNLKSDKNRQGYIQAYYLTSISSYEDLLN